MPRHSKQRRLESKTKPPLVEASKAGAVCPLCPCYNPRHTARHYPCAHPVKIQPQSQQGSFVLPFGRCPIDARCPFAASASSRSFSFFPCLRAPFLLHLPRNTLGESESIHDEQKRGSDMVATHAEQSCCQVLHIKRGTVRRRLRQISRRQKAKQTERS